ncbi:MAG: ribonuclease HI family protein [bacterium]|nr:ribonuclease HI family protein [bacterium]
MNKVIIYIDGGSRGNPGPSAIGVVIDLSLRAEGEAIPKRLPRAKALAMTKIGERKEYSKFLGEATNNEAEYQAAIFALKKIKHLIGGEKSEKVVIEIRSDSELLVKQVNGQYKIKEKNLIPFFIEIWNLKQDFAGVKFVQISREENKQADLLVNRELNSQTGLF